MCTHLVVKPHR